MAAHHIVPFSAPVRSIHVAGQAAPTLFTYADLEAARCEGYHRGAEETARTLERQMLEQRDELIHLQSQTFVALSEQRSALVDQVRELLPQLVMEGVARMLGGFQPEREALTKIVEDLLGELTPTGEVIDVQLNAQDLELISGYEANLREKFPAIAFRIGSDLKPGDAVVRSRFGTVDGRLSTKFKMVEALFQ